MQKEAVQRPDWKIVWPRKAKLATTQPLSGEGGLNVIWTLLALLEALGRHLGVNWVFFVSVCVSVCLFNFE